VSRKRKPTIKASQLKSWGLLKEFNAELSKAVKKEPLDPRWEDPKRELNLADYLGLFLLGVFNPVVDSMRGICQASHLDQVRKVVGSKPVSLGSFSEAQSLVDPGLLHKVYRRLAKKVTKSGKKATDKSNRYAQMMQVVDSTLWYALPRMHWAVWRKQYKTQRALRLHVRFQVADEMPSDFTITEGRRCERLEWEKMVQPGDFTVGDRYYGEDYGLLRRIMEKDSSFAIRLRTNAKWVEEEELPIEEADRKEGVVWHAWVRLGIKGKGPRVRIVQISGDEEQILVATNLSPKEMSAELVSLCYRDRWQVELFFRWLKHVMKTNHWMAESENGVTIQIYLTLISAQLLLLFTKERPTKRIMELLQFMSMGMATPEEVVALIQKIKAPRKKQAS